MKKILSVAILLCSFSYVNKLTAQTTTFSESFNTTTNLCPQWTTFQNAITPGIYTGIRMSGTFDLTGYVCNDPVIANAMAVAIKNSSAYISPSTNGHVWSVCNRYQAEVWIDPPSLCDGANCPSPGYLMRPCFGTTIWGGVNSATCSSVPQVMTLELIAPPPCAQPTGVVATSITTTSAQLSWTPVSGSAGYEYVIDQNSASPSGSGTPTGSTSVPIGGLNINTNYYFHVRNKCTSILYSLWTNYPFTTADAYCKPPLNIFFSNITNNTVDILWSQMPTATSYQYKIDLSPVVPNSGNSIGTPGISAHIGSLLPDTKYYVQVRSICLNGNDSSTWKLDSFVTKNFCGAPELHVPVSGTNNPDVWWYKVNNAVAYEYRLSNFNVPPSFGTEIHDTTVSLQLPLDNSDQYLHVRTKCNSQFSFSQWSTITLRSTPSAITNVQGVEAGIIAYPNPVKDILIVEVKDLQNAANATISLTDIAGRVLLTTPVVSGKTTLSTRGIAPGIYLVKYANGEHTEITRVNKQ